MLESYSDIDEVENHFSSAVKHFEMMINTLKNDDSLKKEHGDIEKCLNTQGYELLRRMLQGYFDLRADKEVVRESVEGTDGVERTHRRPTVRKKVASLFGEVYLHRIGYSQRNANALYPMDMSLNLSPTKYSDGLRYRLSEEAARNSFDESIHSISTTTGGHIPKRQCEQIVSEVAQDFESYYESTYVDEKDNSNLLVTTCDSKGIVMRKQDLRPATKKAAEAEKASRVRLSPGEKKNRKRMATAASVYSVDRSYRSAKQIMDTATQKPKRSIIENKRVWASVERGQETVINEAFEEAASRDPDFLREWVTVVDGELTQLSYIQKKLKELGCKSTIILDFIHVLEYLWKASHCFNKVGSVEAEKWVQEKAIGVLNGKSSDIAAGIRRSATRRNLSQTKRKAVDKCADYLQNNKQYLKYDVYLKKGYPIASGVIEGACRHLINDRLGITGARWGLTTAEAVLKIRSLRSSGDFEDYWKFHKKKELDRNHCSKYKKSKMLRKAG